MLYIRFDIPSMKTLKFMIRWFCGNKNIGHPYPLKFVRIFDMNNDVSGKLIFDQSFIGRKYTANI